MDDFTQIKKEMTSRMVELYCRCTHGGEALCDDCRADLDMTMRHLDTCRFKDKGWPCPTCPECCFQGKDRDTMMRVIGFAEQWVQDHPEMAASMRPPVGP